MASQNYQILVDKLMNSGFMLHKTLDNISTTDLLIEVTNATIEWYLSINDLVLMASDSEQNNLQNDLNLRRMSNGGTILDYKIKYGAPVMNFDFYAIGMYVEKVRRTIDFSMEFLRENINRFPTTSEVFLLDNSGKLFSKKGELVRNLDPEELPFKIIKYLYNKKHVQTEVLLKSIDCANKNVFYKSIENFNKDFKKKTLYSSNLINGLPRQGYIINPIFSIKLKK
ncbi:MAG: hypothetical protein WCQ47_08295 [bacterium]